MDFWREVSLTAVLFSLSINFKIPKFVFVSGFFSKNLSLVPRRMDLLISSSCKGCRKGSPSTFYFKGLEKNDNKMRSSCEYFARKKYFLFVKRLIFFNE